MEKVAIIVPVYKVESYIKRCVDSLLNQTYKNIQVILVDDGSPDNCGKICDEYAKNDNRVICIHKDNGGQSDARNVGLEWLYKNSDAGWISFVDSDDWIHEQYIEFLKKAVDQCDSDVSICSFVATNDSKCTIDINETDAKLINPEDLWS